MDASTAFKAGYEIGASFSDRIVELMPLVLMLIWVCAMLFLWFSSGRKMRRGDEMKTVSFADREPPAND